MKKFIAPVLVGIVLAIGLASCGSTRGGHCEAYGSSVNNTQSLPTE